MNIINVLKEIQESKKPLSEMEYPEYVTQLDALPYMKNGKVDYHALEKKAQANEA